MFVVYKVEVKTFFFQMDIQLTRCRSLKKQPFSQWHHCQKLTVCVWTYFWYQWMEHLFCFIGLFGYARTTAPYVKYYRFMINFDIQNYKSFNFVIFFKMVYAVLSSFHFHTNFRIKLWISKKNYSWNFVWDCICLRLHLI